MAEPRKPNNIDATTTNLCARVPNAVARDLDFVVNVYRRGGLPVTRSTVLEVAAILYGGQSHELRDQVALFSPAQQHVLEMLTKRIDAIGPVTSTKPPPASPSTKPAPSPGSKPAPVRRESEREELERLRAEAYAQLTDYERADAAKIKDPVARARFVAGRLARRAKR